MAIAALIKRIGERRGIGHDTMEEDCDTRYGLSSYTFWYGMYLPLYLFQSVH